MRHHAHPFPAINELNGIIHDKIMAVNPPNIPITTPLSPNTAPEPIGKRMVLEEQRRAFDKVSEASNSLDQKLQSLLGSASLVVSLVGVLQLPTLKLSTGDFFWWVFVPALLLYISMVVTTILGLRPLKYLDPIDSNWDVLAARYFDESEDHVLEYLISDYLAFIEINRNLNQRKTRALNWAAWQFAALVVVIVTSLPISLGP